jgi:hypothetical protein
MTEDILELMNERRKQKNKDQAEYKRLHKKIRYECRQAR